MSALLVPYKLVIKFGSLQGMGENLQATFLSQTLNNKGTYMISVEDIYNAVIQNEESKKEFYRWLGASLIGSECTRHIALTFCCAYNNNFSARILRVFENGHQAEQRIGADIKLTGAKIIDEQLEIDAPNCNGHAGSTLDGVIEFANGEQMILEYKTAKSVSFKKYVKDPIKISNPRYYAQVQVNMALRKLKKAMWICENKDTNELHIEYIDYNEEDALYYLNLMKKFIVDGFTGDKISDNPDYFQCRWCAANSICHGKAVPRMHCLTCCHATPIAGGKFKCMRYNAEMPDEQLPKGCDEHVFHPDFINLPMVDNGPYWISYRLPTGELICNCSKESFPRIKINEEMKDIVTSEEWAKRGVLYED